MQGKDIFYNIFFLFLSFPYSRIGKSNSIGHSSGEALKCWNNSSRYDLWINYNLPYRLRRAIASSAIKSYFCLSIDIVKGHHVTSLYCLLMILQQGSQTRDPRSSQKMYVMRIFIEMLEFLCCFGNVVNNAIKMKKYSHILQHMWPLRAFS